MSNQQLANEFHKPIIRKFKNRRVYSPFKNNIWDADLPETKLRSKKQSNQVFIMCH